MNVGGPPRRRTTTASSHTRTATSPHTSMQRDERRWIHGNARDIVPRPDFQSWTISVSATSCASCVSSVPGGKPMCPSPPMFRRAAYRSWNADNSPTFGWRPCRTIARTLEMEIAFEARWRGGKLTRLRDHEHAALCRAGRGLPRRPRLACDPRIHVPAICRERGSVDVLAWHPVHSALLIVEVKGRIIDVQDLLASVDRKRRVVPGEARRQLGCVAYACRCHGRGCRYRRRPAAHRRACGDLRCGVPLRSASEPVRGSRMPNGPLRGHLADRAAWAKGRGTAAGSPAYGGSRHPHGRRDAGLR